MTNPELEPQPKPSELDEVTLHGRSLRQWHKWLNTDHHTGGSTAGDIVPCSRYGRDSDECSYWSLACEYIYVNANGENSDESPIEALEHYMGLAVNDHDDVLDLVRTYWHEIPQALRDKLDYEENGLNLPQQVRLIELCRDYEVDYDPEHYFVHPPNSWMTPGWAEGWVGGKPGTIFVGVSPEGESYS